MFNVESSGEKIVTNYPSRVLESKTEDMTMIIEGKGGETFEGWNHFFLVY